MVVMVLLLWAFPGLAQDIDYRYDGMWYQPQLAGHGFNLTLQPDGEGQAVFLAFFTYDDEGQANFYAGNVNGVQWRLGESLEIPMQQTAGSGFATPSALDFSDPAQFQTVGSVWITLRSCNRGWVDYALAERSSGAMVQNAFEIEKLIGVPLSVCRAGMAKGAVQRQTRVEPLGLSAYRYFLYIPTGYDPGQPAPIMLALHGAAGPGQAEVQAEAVRDLWQSTAEQEGFLVLAQTGTSPNGSWIPENTELILDQLLGEIRIDYAVDIERIYGWGFSAGGHVMHAIGLTQTDRFAGYAVNAGVLGPVLGRAALADVPRTLPVSSLVGVADTRREEARGDRDAFLAEGWSLGEDLFYREFPGGHTVTAQHLSEHWSNLASAPKDRP